MMSECRSIDSARRRRQALQSLNKDRSLHRNTSTCFHFVAARRELNRVLLVLLAIGALVALACSGSDDAGDLETQAASTPAPTSTLEIAPTQAPSVGPTDTSRDLAGFPFSTADLRQRIETGGYSFLPVAA